jgi:hypothetical protein
MGLGLAPFLLHVADITIQSQAIDGARGSENAGYHGNIKAGHLLKEKGRALRLRDLLKGYSANGGYFPIFIDGFGNAMKVAGSFQLV